MAIGQRQRVEVPTFGRVRLRRLDPDARVEMMRTIDAPTMAASKIIDFSHGAPMARLAEGYAQQIVDGRAMKGVEISSLSTSGHIRAGFTDQLGEVIDLAVRCFLPMYGQRAFHEYITSIPVVVGKEMNGIGADQNPNATRVAHILLAGIGGKDRTFFHQIRFLLSGTTGDHSSLRADLEKIELWKSELGRVKLAGPIHEHLQDVFESETTARRCVEGAVDRGEDPFAFLPIGSEEFIDVCCPRCVILDRLPFSPPIKRAQASGDEVFPGDDEAIVEVVEDAGRYGIARCETKEPKVDLDALEDELLPELCERFGEKAEVVAPGLLGEVASWDIANDLGVGVDISLVKYWHFPEAGYLLRAKQVSGPGGGQIVDTDVWRMIRLDRKLLKETITLVERAHQCWPSACADRHREESGLGLVRASKAPQREGLLKISLLANGAGVSAHRDMERRNAGLPIERLV
jgi:hypothetical protein